MEPVRRSRPLALCLPPAAVIAALSGSTAAQFNDPWASFSANPGMLSSGPLSSATDEVDFCAADLDQDGWTDLAVMRKEPFTKAGKRQHVLLMNEAGVLTDRTALYAMDSDFPGDLGFRTPTNNRDSVAVDVDGDGWLDLVTATALGDTDPKHISHPRVYRNEQSSGGAWLGLRHENGRIPQLFVAGSGAPGIPRFTEVLPGDVDGDGDIDLYFVDHDDGVGGYHQVPGTDLQDRLLINDGAGVFQDQTAARMSIDMVQDTFGTSGSMVDINLDGVLDIVKNDTNSPNVMEVAYNNPANEGFFNIRHEFSTTLAPYFMETGDLNNDGRLDVIAGDDTSDRFFYNTGNDPLGRVIWSAPLTFEFLSGSEGEFTGQIVVADLNNDGWKDVLIADQDVDVAAGSGHRMHIYHNRGGTPGSFTLRPREERKSASSDPGNWIGVVGMEFADLTNTFDVAAFDVDRDGDLDLVVGRSAGTFAWENQLDPSLCQPSVGFGGPGTSALTLCGPALAAGKTGTLQLTGAPPGMPIWFVAGATANPVPIFGGTLVPVPWQAVIGGFQTNGSGAFTLNGIAGGGGPSTVYLQAVVLDLSQPELVGFSNALEVLFLP